MRYTYFNPIFAEKNARVYLENDGDYIIANVTLSLQLLRILDHTVCIHYSGYLPNRDGHLK